MKKNEETQEEKQLVWKLAEKPSGHVVAELVANGVITKDEARYILFREETKQSDEVIALKEMVNALQEMVKDLLSRPNSTTYVPYTKVVEVPARFRPHWDRVWMGTEGNLSTWTNTATGSNGNAVYTLSTNIK